MHNSFNYDKIIKVSADALTFLETYRSGHNEIKLSGNRHVGSNPTVSAARCSQQCYFLLLVILFGFMKYGLIICFLLKNTKKYSKIIKVKLKIAKNTKDDNDVSPQMRGYFYAILYVKKMAMVFRMVMPDRNTIH